MCWRLLFLSKIATKNALTIDMLRMYLRAYKRTSTFTYVHYRIQAISTSVYTPHNSSVQWSTCSYVQYIQ